MPYFFRKLGKMWQNPLLAAAVVIGFLRVKVLSHARKKTLYISFCLSILLISPVLVLNKSFLFHHYFLSLLLRYGPRHGITNNVVYATSKAADQP